MEPADLRDRVDDLTVDHFLEVLRHLLKYELADTLANECRWSCDVDPAVVLNPEAADEARAVRTGCMPDAHSFGNGQCRSAYVDIALLEESGHEKAGLLDVIIAEVVVAATLGWLGQAAELGYDGYHCAAGFGFNLGSAVDCGSVAVPFVKSSSDEVADVARTTDEGRRFWTIRAEFRGKTEYQRDDLIDPTKVVDQFGNTNLDLMQAGRAPIGPDGNPINLHHLMQSETSALAEVTQTMHQQYDAILHMPVASSAINRSAFDRYRAAYWEQRACDFGGC
ncbi:MAG: HNH/ENDO VII family nuclease [Actinomycetota bacterium]